jgi:hypothetical protein
MEWQCIEWEQRTRHKPGAAWPEKETYDKSILAFYLEKRGHLENQ